MKKYLLSTSLLFGCLFNAHAQAPNWLWAKNAQPIFSSIGATVVATDAAGDVYITGYFADATITFGSYTLNNANPVGGVSNDIFVVKYDPSGNVLWAKRDGGVYDEAANGIALDGNGNIYVTGYFDAGSTPVGDTAIFGTTVLVNDSSNTTEDMFIVKYDNNGNEQWAKSAGGSADDEGSKVACDLHGNVYVIGSSESESIAFDTFDLDTAVMFLVKYDSTGNVLWAKRGGGDLGNEGSDQVSAVTTDKSNDVYIAGGFLSDSTAFGPFTLYNTNGGNQSAIFLVKYDSSGDAIWAKTGVSFPPQFVIDMDQIFSIATDASGNVFSTGPFGSDSIQFGATTVINSNPSFGKADIFLVKWDSNGNILWANSAQSTSATGQVPYSIATDIGGDVYMGGYFDESDTVQFGPSVSISSLCTSALGNIDVFFAKYDANGNALWAQGASAKYCASVDICNGIATDLNGNLFAVGTFTGDSLDFASISLQQPDTALAGLFIAKLAATPTGFPDPGVPSAALYIFPNPAKGSFTIRLNTDIQTGQVDIFDMLGNKVFSEEMNNYSSGYDKLIQLPLSAGTYFTIVTDGEKQYQGRVAITP